MDHSHSHGDRETKNLSSRLPHSSHHGLVLARSLGHLGRSQLLALYFGLQSWLSVLDNLLLDGQVIDNAVHPPELVLEEDLDGFDLHEVLKLLEQTSADHGYEGHPGRVESIEVVPGTPVRVFSEHLEHEAQKNEKEGGEMGDAAMDWGVKRVEEVAGVKEV